MLVRNRSTRLITVNHGKEAISIKPLEEVDMPSSFSKSSFFEALVNSEDLICLNSSSPKKTSSK